MSRRALVALAAGAVVLAVGAAALTGPGDEGGDGARLIGAGRVSSVVDGDTVRVDLRGVETTVRLVGIDTPETREPPECFGPEAAARVARLVPPGTLVRLEGDPTQDARDRYGRVLAYVYRDGAAGARGSVNHALVAGGHARVYVYAGVPFRYAGAFAAAERDARREGRGLWGPACASPPPPAPRR